MSFIRKYSWLLIVLAFIFLISAWSTLIHIASDHKPEMIEIEKTEQ